MTTSAHTRGQAIVVEGSPFQSFQGLGFTYMPAGRVADASGVGGDVDTFYGVPLAPFKCRIIGAVVVIETSTTGSDDTVTIQDGGPDNIATLAIPNATAGDVLYFPAVDDAGDLTTEFSKQFLEAGDVVDIEYAGTATAGAYTVMLLCTSV